MKEPTLADVVEARGRIARHIHRTPVLTSHSMDDWCGAKLLFKCENFQRAGVFKSRGAFNAVLALSEAEARNGVVTHSSGNHGAALALAARIQAETGARMVHPYNDALVIAGQGTVGLEFLEEHPDLDAVVGPIGGGGHLAGTAIAAKGLKPGIRVLGAEPEGADDAARSLRAGRLIAQTNPQTIADGLRSSLGDITFPLLQRHVDDIITVSEPAIVDAMRLIWSVLKIVIEPSSAVAVAAARRAGESLAGRRVGIILTGGNADLENLPWATAGGGQSAADQPLLR